MPSVHSSNSAVVEAEAVPEPQSLLEYIDFCINALRESRDFQSLVKDKLGFAVEDARPGELSAADLWNLYWNSDVTTNSLGAHMGVPASMVCRHVGPGPSVQCSRCGGTAYPKTRTAMRTVPLKPNGRHEGIRCDECLDSRAAELEAFHADQDELRRIRREQEARRLHDLRSMPYQEYLRTPEWQGTRLSALKRAKYRCQLCNVASTLDVHHNTYERRGCELPRDVIVLCRQCHSLHHGKVTK